MTVRPGGEVAGVNRYVTSKIRVLLPERSGYGVNAICQHRVIGAELLGEAVASPHAWACIEASLKPRMLCDQGRYSSPGRQSEQTLDEASADEGAVSKPERLKSTVLDEGRFHHNGGAA